MNTVECVCVYFIEINGVCMVHIPFVYFYHSPDLFSKQIENRRFNVNLRMQQYNLFFFATVF